MRWWPVDDALGFTFRQGPEVPPPLAPDFTEGEDYTMLWRTAWAEELGEAARYHDAWGLLRMRPDGDVTLYDVVTPGSLMAATDRGGRIWLLLARETPRC